MKIFGINVSFHWMKPRDPDEAIIPFNPARVKLGRPLPPVVDKRTLRFANYVTGLPKAPEAVDYGNKVVRILMLANDKYGNCTCAGILHAIMIWLSQNGFAFAPTDDDAISLYERLCNYIRGRPETDQGGIEIDILKKWRKQPIAGCELAAFAAVDPTNWEHVKLAHYLGGTLYMGVNLPLSSQKPGPWRDLKDAPGGWGGHCMVTSAYTDKRSLCGLLQSRKLTAWTWGTTQDMTPEWVAKYCDELYVLITPSWFSKAGIAPNGFNMAQLMADVAAVAHSPIN